MSKIIDAIWFTQLNGCIGIVLTEDEVTKMRKAYIGTGRGNDEGSDAKIIQMHGGKVSPVLFKKIYEYLSDESPELLGRNEGNTLTLFHGFKIKMPMLINYVRDEHDRPYHMNDMSDEEIRAIYGALATAAIERKHNHK
jgi:hypothetical protein